MDRRRLDLEALLRVPYVEPYGGFDLSPDGKQILFGSERDGNQEIYIVDADGENLRNLTRKKLRLFGNRSVWHSG